VKCVISVPQEALNITANTDYFQICKKEKKKKMNELVTQK